MTTTHIQVPDEVYRDSGAQTSVQRMFVRDGYLAGLAAHNATAWGGVLADVAAERVRQEAKFPEQHLPDGTNEKYAAAAEQAKADTDEAAADGTLTWLHVQREEYYEALAETDPDRLRTELIQVAAVAARWVEDIDRRVAAKTMHTEECDEDGGCAACRVSQDPLLDAIERGLCGGGEEQYDVHVTHQDVAERIAAEIRSEGWVAGR